MAAGAAAPEAAATAMRYHPTRRAFSDRLRAAGTAPTVALVAGMHTLLHILDAFVRSGTPWRTTTPA